VKTLYELFTGDGMIQGVFFDGKGNMTPVKQMIDTEKRVFEKKYGKTPKHIVFSILSYWMYKMKMIPNLLGYANTALGKVQNKLYAFYERDMPYLLNIDLENQRIQTIKRVSIQGVETCSGHTKYNGKTVDTVDYDVYNKQVHYFELDASLQGILSVHSLKTNNIPIIHDFVVLQNPKRILIMDSPYVLDIGLFLQSKIPVSFDPTGSTYIHLLETSTGKKRTYKTENEMVIFHYADVIETTREIEILASVYEKISFNDLKIVGRYRKLYIDKWTGYIGYSKNPELEKYNLDFPVIWDRDGYGKNAKYKRVILRNFNGERNNGFVICEGLEIIKEIFFESLSISGEPAIIKGKCGTSFLFSLAYNEFQQGYLIVVNLQNWEVEEFALGMEVGIGFHSIFTNETI
jgi:carotenoid cleavage dioxygenase-like enzyme